MAPTGKTSHEPAAAAMSRTSATTAGVVGDRVGVRHRRDGREPADRGGARARLDRLLVLEAGLAQVRVEVDEPGREHQARRSRRPRRRRRPSPVPTAAITPSSTSTSATLVACRRPGRPPARRVNSDRPLSHRVAPSPPPPSNRYRSDIRTAMPFVTCSSITACGRSATSESISTPRFIGPGCMIERALGQHRRPLAREPEQPRVLAHAREVLLPLALPLHAEHVADVELRQHRVDVVAHLARPTRGASGGISVGGPTA